MTVVAVVILLGIVQGFLLGIVLLSYPRGNREANKVLGILMISFSLSIGNIFFDAAGLLLDYPHLMFLAHPLVFLFGPLFLLYVYRLTRPEFVLKVKHLFHLVPCVALYLYLIPYILMSADEKIAYYNQHSSQPSAADLIVTPLQIVALFIYLGVVVNETKRHENRVKNFFSSIERINLRWIRTFVYLLSGVFVVMGIFILVALVGYGGFARHYAGPTVGLLVSVSIYTFGYLGLRQPEIFIGTKSEEEPAHKYERSSLTAERADEYYDRLMKLMDEKKPYIDRNLNVQLLAKLVSIPAHHLSQIINERCRQNFFDFVSKYRIEEVKVKLADPKNDHLTIVALAFDSGFNSKSVFNAAFRKHTGLTPSEYRSNLKSRC